MKIIMNSLASAVPYALHVTVYYYNIGYMLREIQHMRENKLTKEIKENFSKLLLKSGTKYSVAALGTSVIAFDKVTRTIPQMSQQSQGGIIVNETL